MPTRNGTNALVGSSELVRLAVTGSVDDGKSSLIGRLLYETKRLFDDQFEHVARLSRANGHGYTNLALVTDGLRAEREQGITIDVAYRHFETPRRKFIIADTPGHEQYTRNMLTGVSTADIALVLIDARWGLTEQTRRHAVIASLLHVPHVVVCINKMDLVAWDDSVFERIVGDFRDWAARLELPDLSFIPLCALHGDNVVERSTRMPWYAGPPLLYLLEHKHVASDRNLIDCRFPVQYVIRPGSERGQDYRGYAGRVESGVFHPGDDVLLLPSGVVSRIATIETCDGPVDAAFPPLSVTIRLEDDIDVSRGDMICRPGNHGRCVRELEAMVCWMSDRPAREGTRYRLKHTTRAVLTRLNKLYYRIDVNTLQRDASTHALCLNEIGRLRLWLSEPLVIDDYRRNGSTGSFILIDEGVNDTVGAGMVLA